MWVSLSEKAIGRGFYIRSKVQVRGDKIYLNDKHKQLIQDSIKLNLVSPLSEDQIEELIKALHKASKLEDCEIIIYITGGNGDQGIYVDVSLLF